MSPFLYMLCAVLLHAFGELFYYIFHMAAFYALFSLVSIGLFLYGVWRGRTKKEPVCTRLISFTWVVLCLIQWGVLLRVFNSDWEIFEDMSTSGIISYILCYKYYVLSLLPIFAFRQELTQETMPRLAKIGIATGICFLVLFLINSPYLLLSSYDEVELLGIDETPTVRFLANVIISIGMLNIFLIFFSPYLPKSCNLFNFGIWFIAFVMQLRGAGRTGIVYFVMLGLLAFYLRFKLLKTVLLCAIVAGALIAIDSYTDSRLFGHIMERGLQDSRSQINEYLTDDLDETPSDWITGRGLNGRYFCFKFTTSKPTWRYEIETGFLHLILRGGYLYLVFFILPLLLCAIYGFFGKNQFCKAAAGLLLIRIAMLLPFGLPVYSVADVMTWFLAGLACCPGIRNATDEEIRRKYFRFPEKKQLESKEVQAS